MRKIFAFWFLFFALLTSSLARADEKSEKFEGLLNKLLAPGPLVLGHENLEHKDCLKCHEAGGGVPNKNCLDCHKDINAHVEAKKHFHGLMNGINLCGVVCIIVYID